MFEEFSVCELGWRKFRAPNDNDLTTLSDTLAYLEEETQILKNRQPDCKDFLENYEREFDKYTTRAENLRKTNEQALNQIGALVFTEERIENLRSTIEFLRNLNNEKWSSLNAEGVEYTARILWRLICLNRELDGVKPELCSALEKVRGRLENNRSVLDGLLTSTHQWIVLESPKRKYCTRCSREINLEEIEQAKDKQAEERQKKIKRIRDSETL